MSVFVCPSQLPEQIDKGCYVVPQVSFIEEIEKCRSKQPRGNIVSRYHLREIIAAITSKYMSPEFDTLMEVNISNAVGKIYNSDEELNDILIDLFDRVCPKIYDGYAMWYLKNRPLGTKLVYFMPGKRGNMALYQLGLQPIAPKDVDTYLGKKKESKEETKSAKKTAKNSNDIQQEV
jgi:hypothetical protein